MCTRNWSFFQCRFRPKVLRSQDPVIPGGGRSLNTGVWDAFPISWVCRSADQDTGRSNVFLLTSVRVSGSTIGVRPRSILVPFQLSSIKHRWPQSIGRAIQRPLGGFRIFQMSLPWDSWWPGNLANRALRSVPWPRLSKEFLGFVPDRVHRSSIGYVVERFGLG